MEINNALKMLAEEVAKAGDEKLPLLLNAAANEIEQLKAQHDYFKNGMAELQDYIDKMEPELLALRAREDNLTIDWSISRCEALIQQGFEKVRIDVLLNNFKSAKEAHLNILKNKAAKGE